MSRGGGGGFGTANAYTPRGYFGLANSAFGSAVFDRPAQPDPFSSFQATTNSPISTPDEGLLAAYNRGINTPDNYPGQFGNNAPKGANFLTVAQGQTESPIIATKAIIACLFPFSQAGQFMTNVFAPLLITENIQKFVVREYKSQTVNASVISEFGRGNGPSITSSEISFKPFRIGFGFSVGKIAFEGTQNVPVYVAMLMETISRSYRDAVLSVCLFMLQQMTTPFFRIETRDPYELGKEEYKHLVENTGTLNRASGGNVFELFAIYLSKVLRMQDLVYINTGVGPVELQEYFKGKRPGNFVNEGDSRQALVNQPMVANFSMATEEFNIKQFYSIPCERTPKGISILARSLMAFFGVHIPVVPGEKTDAVMTYSFHSDMMVRHSVTECVSAMKDVYFEHVPIAGDQAFKKWFLKTPDMTHWTSCGMDPVDFVIRGKSAGIEHPFFVKGKFFRDGHAPFGADTPHSKEIVEAFKATFHAQLGIPAPADGHDETIDNISAIRVFGDMPESALPCDMLVEIAEKVYKKADKDGRLSRAIADYNALMGSLPEDKAQFLSPAVWSTVNSDPKKYGLDAFPDLSPIMTFAKEMASMCDGALVPNMDIMFPDRMRSVESAIITWLLQSDAIPVSVTRDKTQWTGRKAYFRHLNDNMDLFPAQNPPGGVADAPAAGVGRVARGAAPHADHIFVGARPLDHFRGADGSIATALGGADLATGLAVGEWHAAIGAGHTWFNAQLRTLYRSFPELKRQMISGGADAIERLYNAALADPEILPRFANANGAYSLAETLRFIYQTLRTRANVLPGDSDMSGGGRPAAAGLAAQLLHDIAHFGILLKPYSRKSRWRPVVSKNLTPVDKRSYERMAVLADQAAVNAIVAGDLPDGPKFQALYKTGLYRASKRLVRGAWSIYRDDTTDLTAIGYPNSGLLARPTREDVALANGAAVAAVAALAPAGAAVGAGGGAAAGVGGAAAGGGDTFLGTVAASGGLRAGEIVMREDDDGLGANLTAEQWLHEEIYFVDEMRDIPDGAGAASGNVGGFRGYRVNAKFARKVCVTASNVKISQPLGHGRDTQNNTLPLGGACFNTKTTVPAVAPAGALTQQISLIDCFDSPEGPDPLYGTPQPIRFVYPADYSNVMDRLYRLEMMGSSVDQFILGIAAILTITPFTAQSLIAMSNGSIGCPIQLLKVTYKVILAYSIYFLADQGQSVKLVGQTPTENFWTDPHVKVMHYATESLIGGIRLPSGPVAGLTAPYIYDIRAGDGSHFAKPGGVIFGFDEEALKATNIGNMIIPMAPSDKGKLGQFVQPFSIQGSQFTRISTDNKGRLEHINAAAPMFMAGYGVDMGTHYENYAPNSTSFPVSSERGQPAPLIPLSFIFPDNHIAIGTDQNGQSFERKKIENPIWDAFGPHTRLDLTGALGRPLPSQPLSVRIK